MAELNFATLKAPFDGIIDRLQEQQGSLVKEGDILTTLSDNQRDVGLFQRNRETLPRIHGRNGSQQAELNRMSSSCWRTTAGSSRIPARSIWQEYRRDRGQLQQRDREHRLPRGFSEPGLGLLRHGQTGTVLINRDVERCHRHSSAGDFREPRQAVRLPRRQR